VTPRGPEIRNRCPDCSIILVRVCVDVPGVCDLALGGRVHAVDLRRSEGLEGGQAERFGERVDSCVLEELVACLVDFGRVRVSLEISCARELAGKVVSSI
jgi:hypothetical protein